MPNGPLFSDEPVGTVEAPCRTGGGGAGTKWDVNCILDILCKKDSKVVEQLAKTTVETADELWWDDEFYNGSKWAIKKFPGGGSSSKAAKKIMILSDNSCQDAADTFFHETWHQNQPPSMAWPEPAEDDAYYNSELWSIERGLPGRPELRTTDGAGKAVPDKAKIRAFVQQEYPSPPPPVGGVPQPVPVAADWPNKKTQVEDPVTGARTWRPSKTGDMVSGPQHFKNKKTIAKSDWKCPTPAPPSRGCFIATAAYGSPLAPEVQFLRSLRDDVLRRTAWGARFFERYWSYYYRLSPVLAAEMERDPECREVVRWSIVAPLVNYYHLLLNRPRNWKTASLEPELQRFLTDMERDMEEWLRYVPLPENFDGRPVEEAVLELNIVLDLVLRETGKRQAYLDRLIRTGTLPLRFAPELRPLLAEALRQGGCREPEISTVLDGSRRSPDPALSTEAR